MPSDRRQLALELDYRPALGREDFAIAPCNADAVAWIDAWPGWPEGAVGLNVHGPAGAGKSHLAAVWSKRAEAIPVAVAGLTVANVPDRLGAARRIVVDDVDAGAAVDGEALLHLHNMVAERRGAMLLLSRRPAARLGIDPADLRSRLAAMPSVGIRAPDDTLLSAVMAKLFRDRQLAAPEAVLGYLVARMDRSFAEARRLVRAIDRAALASRRPITVALAREALVARQEERASFNDTPDGGDD